MRKTLLTLTALAGLAGAGLATTAHATPRPIEGATVQTVGYDGGFTPIDYGDGWRAHQWREHARWEHWHRWHAWHEHERWAHRGW